MKNTENRVSVLRTETRSKNGIQVEQSRLYPCTGESRNLFFRGTVVSCPETCVTRELDPTKAGDGFIEGVREV